MKNVLPEELHKSIPTYIRLTCQTFGMRRRIHVLLHVMRRRIHVLQDAYSSACLQRLTCHTFALGFGFEGLGFRVYQLDLPDLWFSFTHYICERSDYTYNRSNYTNLWYSFRTHCIYTYCICILIIYIHYIYTLCVCVCVCVCV